MNIDILRRCRNLLYSAGQFQVLGFHIDVMLHLLVGFTLTLVLRRWLNEKKSSIIVFSLVAAKELIDLFAKSRIEYIRPAGLDLVFDVSAGIAGICLGLILARTLSKRMS